MCALVHSLLVLLQSYLQPQSERGDDLHLFRLQLEFLEFLCKLEHLAAGVFPELKKNNNGGLKLFVIERFFTQVEITE